MKFLIIRTYPTKMDINTYNCQELGLAKAYIDLGHTCDIVFYSGFKKTNIQNIDYNGNKIKVFWIKSINFLNNGIFFGLKKIMGEYDFFQVSEYDQLLSYKIYKKYYKKTYVYQGVYDSKISYKHIFRDFIFDHLFLSKKIKENTIIISKSKLVENDMKKRGFKKISTVGVGMDFDRFKCASKSNEKKYLLYIGRLEKRRNILFLIKVFSKLYLKNNNYRLLIIGNGDSKYKKEIKNAILENSLNDAIVQIDTLNQSDLSKVYADASCFILPTSYEIFGMVILESMFFGVPVITTVNGGSTTLIKDKSYGIILDNFNVGDWSIKIDELINNTLLWNDISKNAKRNVIENYSWKEIAIKILNYIL